MRHHALTAAIGTVLAAALVPLSVTSAAAADPTGYWRKAEQRSKWPGKMQIYRCGNRRICVKIAWVKNPFDERGRPLRDILNSNTSLRSREIVGLPIARGMTQVAGNQWKGNIYNPEDGNTYSATLTLASRNKIVLKGCKAFLLCGERIWVRTSAPPKPEPEVKPEEQQIEASVEPKPETTPEAAPVAAAEAGTSVTTPAEPASAMGEAQMAKPAAEQIAQPGYHFLESATAAPERANFTGNDLPSMFVMTTPVDQAPVAAAEGAPAPAAVTPAAAPAPVPQPKPRPETRAIEANAAPAPPPAPKPVAAPAPAPKPVAAPKPAPAPAPAPEPEVADVESTETADATEAAPERPLTWRERRKLRRQQRLRQSQGLPWIR